MSEFREKLVDKRVYEISVKNYLKKIESIQEFLIWRASLAGEMIYKFLEKHQLADRVKGFIDSDPKKYSSGEGFLHLNVLSPQEALKESQSNNNLCIIVGDPIGGDITNKILLLGFDENKLDTVGYHLACIDSIQSISRIQSHIESYEKVYSILSDERSKEIYLSKLNYYMSGDNHYLENLTDNNKQYFDKNIIKLKKDEVFVDCGSFNGDTLEIFQKVSNGYYREYIALEADSNTYKELIEKIKNKQYKNIKTFNNACWYEQTELRFQPQSTSGHITKEGTLIVKANSLDNLLNNKRVTFIKMDIEGAEENALKGAEKLIREYKPILAICIYHSIEDYYKLPLIIKELNQEYQLFIRHYNDKQYNETVCYAIPKERSIYKEILKQKLVPEEIYRVNLKKYVTKIASFKEIIIWGASFSGQLTYNFLREFHLDDKVIAYADNDSNKWGAFDNLRVLSPNEVLQKVQLEDNTCIINAVNLSEIKDQLILLGISEDKIDMQCHCIMQAYLVNKKEIISSHIDKYEKVYSMLSDNRSKELYLAKLNYFLSGDIKYLENIKDNGIRYFDETLIRLSDDEVFIDCGSFNGDTLDVFYQLTKGRYKKYVAIEAVDSTYEELIKKIRDKNYSNVLTLKKACWYKKSNLRFSSILNFDGNRVIEDGNIIVEADSLDNLLDDEQITFIKMDIEGAEENALKGAEKLIKRYKPILAICIYHSIEDHYKLPLLMKKLNEEYQLFIRHYMSIELDTICYAIPKNRILS